jgi:hypothetical protein
MVRLCWHTGEAELQLQTFRNLDGQLHVLFNAVDN